MIASATRLHIVRISRLAQGLGLLYDVKKPPRHVGIVLGTGTSTRSTMPPFITQTKTTNMTKNIFTLSINLDNRRRIH
jgi:hypothetical protein